MSEVVSRRSTKSMSLNPRAMALTVGGISIILALIASFGLAAWAEASALNHGLQHVLLFTAGIGVGGSALTLITSAKRTQK